MRTTTLITLKSYIFTGELQACSNNVIAYWKPCYLFHFSCFINHALLYPQELCWPESSLIDCFILKLLSYPRATTDLITYLFLKWKQKFMTLNLALGKLWSHKSEVYQQDLMGKTYLHVWDLSLKTEMQKQRPQCKDAW